MAKSIITFLFIFITATNLFGQDSVVLGKGQTGNLFWVTADYRRIDSPRNFGASYRRSVSMQQQRPQIQNPWSTATMVFKVKNLSGANKWEIHHVSSGALVDLYQVTNTNPFSYFKLPKTGYKIEETGYSHNVFTADIQPQKTTVFILEVIAIHGYETNIVTMKLVPQLSRSKKNQLYILCALLTIMLIFTIIKFILLKPQNELQK